MTEGARDECALATQGVDDGWVYPTWLVCEVIYKLPGFAIREDIVVIARPI